MECLIYFFLTRSIAFCSNPGSILSVTDGTKVPPLAHPSTTPEMAGVYQCAVGCSPDACVPGRWQPGCLVCDPGFGGDCSTYVTPAVLGARSFSPPLSSSRMVVLGDWFGVTGQTAGKPSGASPLFPVPFLSSSPC